MMNSPINRLRLLTLNVGMCCHDGDWNWKNVRSPFARLYYVTEGTAQVEMPSGLMTLRPHHLYFIPAYTLHNDICTSIFTHYYIHIYEDPINGEGMLDELEIPFEVEACELDLQLMQRLCETNPQMQLNASNPQTYDTPPVMMYNLQQNLKRPLHLQSESRGILFILISRFLQYAHPKIVSNDNRIRQAVTYICNHLDSELVVGQLADRFCMSRDHFIRIFRRETGETPNNYITRKRMDRSELLLLTTDTPVKQIASQMGYNNVSYFIKHFREATGVTPRQYRKTFK